MPLILGTNSIKDTSYSVANSLRFEDDNSDFLNRTPSSSGNRKTWTFSAWIKRAELGRTQNFFSAGSGGDYARIQFNSNDAIYIAHVNGGSTTTELQTTQVFRDTSAWMHVLWHLNTTDSTASNREKLYINGVEATFDTSTSDYGFPAEDYEDTINENVAHYIGNQVGAHEKCSLYMTEVVFIDGTAQANTDLGEFDEDSPRIWKPKDPSSLTFGTNGFYLDFENSGSLGADVSGNGNNFTVNNLTSVDQSIDTCTNNFATLNPLAVNNNNNQHFGDFSEGNLKIVGNATTNNANAYSTIGFRKGKWYMETKILGTSTHYPNLGIVPFATSVLLFGSGQVGADTISFAYKTTGQKTNNTDSSYGDSFTTNDIIGIAVDMDNGAIYFSKNGTFQASGDPTSGSSRTNSAFNFTPRDNEDYFFAFAVYKTDSGIECNFGSPSYSISSGNSDAEGFGNFEYAPPSGYFALCTKNLAEYG